jgi:hypothetical protein
MTLCTVLLSLCLVGSAWAGTEQCPSDGENKVDVSGGSSFTCPDGVVVGIMRKPKIGLQTPA